MGDNWRKIAITLIDPGGKDAVYRSNLTDLLYQVEC
jgi:hypothetical protein